MQKENVNGLKISIRTALSARNCAKKGEIISHGLTLAKDDKKFLNELRKIQGEYFGKEEVFERLHHFINTEVKPDWFKLKAQYDFIVHEEAVYQEALASFFVGKKVMAANIGWNLPINYRMGDSIVCEIYGTATAVYEENGCFIAVTIVDGEPAYSKMARLPHKKPENSPELIATYLGLSPIYGAALKVMLVYTRPRKSTDDSYFSEYQNIVSADFANCNKEELKHRLVSFLTQRFEEADCSLCRFEAICSGMCIPKYKGEDDSILKPAKTYPKFTKSQQKVVDFKDGTCAVYAVPGAGKTTTLVYRLKALLDDCIDPKSILFVTFTNKACEEIKTRVKELLHTDFEDELPDIYTYNGLGWQILRDHKELVGDLKLLTGMDEKRLLLECISDYPEALQGFSVYRLEGKYGLLSTLLNCFKRLEDIEERDKELEKLAAAGKSHFHIEALKERLQQKIRDEHYIGFDEQIILAKDLLNNNPEICTQYGQKWSYIMADEFQDSSQDNVELLYLIANAGSNNLVVVGDPDQSIYEWRDGSPEYLLNFKNSFPSCSQIYMKDNFRSVKQILDASNHLISKNLSRIQMFMVAHKDSKALPYRMKSCSLHHVPEILELLKAKNYEYGDIAILSRNNAALVKVRALLHKLGIDSLSPFDFLVKDHFFILVKDILDLFYLGFSNDTDMAFLRYLLSCEIDIPEKRNNGESFYRNLILFLKMAPIDVNCMDSIMAYEIEDKDRQEDSLYQAFLKLYRLHLRFKEHSSAALALDDILYAFHADPEMPAYKELIRILDMQDIKGLHDFWEYLCFMVDLEDDRKIEHEPVSEKVNLLTAHGSKGKEFPAVIILQAEDFGCTEEERRLLYVAMTRAKKVLFTLESNGKESELLNEINDYVLTQSLM